MKIYAAGSRASKRAPSASFTGIVWQDPIVDAPAPARLKAIRVVFDPSARTAWHHHPYGQTLHVVAGAGLMGLRGEAPKRIRPGDTVWIPPGEEHWHGATPECGMVHIAMQEADEGVTAVWLDLVTDEEYSITPEG